MKRIAMLSAVGMVFGLALLLVPSDTLAQCACECIDADGDTLADDEECCTPLNPADPEGTIGGLQEDGVCGCIDVGGQAATNGKIDESGPSGCINVGDTDTNDVLGGGDCAQDGLGACRAGGCTTVTIDSGNCGS